jgi:hypothetical protein
VFVDPQKPAAEVAAVVCAADLEAGYAEITAGILQRHPVDVINAYAVLCAVAMARVRLLEERAAKPQALECGRRWR